MQNKAFSVVIVCHNERDYLQRTLHSLSSELPVRAEIIIVDDQSNDGSCDFLLDSGDRYRNVKRIRSPYRLGVSGARNFGAAHARGDILVFSDAHVEAEAGWVRQIAAALADPAVGAVVPAITGLDDPDSGEGFGMRFANEGLDVEWLGRAADEPYAIPLTCGCFLAMRRKVFEELDGFDRGMILYGSEDIEFSLHLWLRGYECRVLPGVTIAHRFAPTFQYRVDWEPLYNRLRMGLVHLGPQRCTQLLTQAQGDAQITHVWERLLNSDVWMRRNMICRARRHDDDWYFERFPLGSA
jgi:GT2 family glycosyltransferase